MPFTTSIRNTVMRRFTVRTMFAVSAALTIQVVLPSLAHARPLRSQVESGTSDGSERAPRFLVASKREPLRVDLRRSPLLSQRLSLDLDGLSVKEALGVIAQRAGFTVVYSDDDLPVGRRVRLRAESMTVVAALTDVLFDAGVD